MQFQSKLGKGAQDKYLQWACYESKFFDYASLLANLLGPHYISQHMRIYTKCLSDGDFPNIFYNLISGKHARYSC